MIIENVRSYYESLWGSPDRKAHFAYDGYKIEIYKWDSDSHPLQINFYATLGMSENIIPAHSSKHRLELFTGLLPSEDRIAESLAVLALEPVTDNTPLGDGHTVTYPNPLWEGTTMRSCLIRRPLTEILPPLNLSEDGLTVDFLQVIPIFSEELQYKKENGMESLMKRWALSKVPYWSPLRQSSI